MACRAAQTAHHAARRSPGLPWPAEQVDAAAAAATQKEANRVLRERRRSEFRATGEDKIEQVKEKLHHH